MRGGLLRPPPPPPSLAFSPTQPPKVARPGPDMTECAGRKFLLTPPPPPALQQFFQRMPQIEPGNVAIIFLRSTPPPPNDPLVQPSKGPLLLPGDLHLTPSPPPPPPPMSCWAAGGGGGAQPRWAVCAAGAGAHQGQTSREGERDIWWTVGTARGRTGHMGLTHIETQRGRLWTACGQRRVDSKNSQTTPAATSTTSIRQLLGAADAQTAHPATFSTAPTHQPLGSANAETTPARAPAAAADRKQRPDATCEGKNG